MHLISHPRVIREHQESAFSAVVRALAGALLLTSVPVRSLQLVIAVAMIAAVALPW
jgi:hypothetical protein